jgi:hypothetical protein
MLQGGWAEWIENNEEIEIPDIEGKFNIGATVSLSDGRTGWVQNGSKTDDTITYDILIDDGGLETTSAGISETELKA